MRPGKTRRLVSAERGVGVHFSHL